MRIEGSEIFRLLVACSIAAMMVVSAACSTTSGAPDEPPSEESADADEDGGEQVVERSLPPLAPLQLSEEEPEVEDLGELDGTHAYRVGDVVVLHRQTPANSVVAARVYVAGGSANLTERTAGIERLALNTAVNGGTESRSKDEFNALLDSMGSSVGAFDERDFSGYSMKSVVDSFDATWDLMVEAMVQAKMPEDELELQRERHLASIRSLTDNPDRLVNHVAGKLLFKGHPYESFQLGTADNVATFTRDEVAAYQRAMLEPARMTVVVVGNVPREALLEGVSKLARIVPSGAITPQETGPLDAEQSEMVVEQKELPTNYILGLFAAPPPGHDDYEAMYVTMRFLRDRLFEEVRTKRNLTYAVSSGLSDRRANFGYLYVTAVDPDATMPVMFDEVEKLKNGDFTAEQLEQSRNVFITRHYMDLETNGSQASLLARSHLIAGDWKAQDETIDRLEAVTPEDVQRVASKYMTNYHFAVVGNPEQIDRALFMQETEVAVDEAGE